MPDGAYVAKIISESKQNFTPLAIAEGVAGAACTAAHISLKITAKILPKIVEKARICAQKYGLLNTSLRDKVSGGAHWIA